MNALTDAIISRVWNAFSERYGQRWIQQYGEFLDGQQLSRTAQTWAKALGHLGLEQISRGFHEDTRRGDSWPPSLPQFLALCEGSGQHWEHRRYEIAQQESANRLPAPKPSYEKARPHLQAIREMLKRGKADGLPELPAK
jgi:hypothetical protein